MYDKHKSNYCWYPALRETESKTGCLLPPAVTLELAARSQRTLFHLIPQKSSLRNIFQYLGIDTFKPDKQEARDIVSVQFNRGILILSYCVVIKLLRGPCEVDAHYVHF